MQKQCAICCVAVLLSLFGTTRTFAQTPFVINGVVDTTAPVTSDPTGNAQELGPVNGTNTKVGVIHSAVPPMLDFTNPNNQVDLQRVWLTRGKDLTSDHQWLYFAWERNANKGSGVISYEFQKAALSPSCVYTGAGIDLLAPASAAETALINSCNPWGNRQAGDFLIIWDQQGSGLTITKRVFQLVGGVLTLGPNTTLGSAQVAISSDGFSGEATINLTTDVFPTDGSCVNFANIIPGTITGNSDTADYKDTVLAPFPDISNCGSLKVTKVTQPTSTPPDPKSFSYTVDRSSGAEVKFDGTTSLPGSVAHGETDEYTSLVAATDFRLNETVPAGYSFVSIACVLEVDGNDPATGTDSATPAEEIGIEVQPSVTTSCTITNRRNEGQLKIIKHVINDNGGTAVAGDFTMFVGNASNTSFAGSEAGTTQTFSAGTTFTVSETGPSGYVQSMAGDCVGTIEVDVLKTCTVTNNDSLPSLTLTKIVVNNNGGTATASAFTLSAAGPTPLSGAGPTVSSGLTFDAGTYTLSESGAPLAIRPVCGRAKAALRSATRSRWLWEKARPAQSRMTTRKRRQRVAPSSERFCMTR